MRSDGRAYVINHEILYAIPFFYKITNIFSILKAVAVTYEHYVILKIIGKVLSHVFNQRI